MHQRFPLVLLSATVKSTLVPPSECLFGVQSFWMSEHAGKFLLWKIQSRSKSYSCPPRQSFTFTCISENRQIWLNLVNDIDDSPFVVPAAVELNILSNDLWGRVYARRCRILAVNASTPKAGSQGVVSVVFIQALHAEGLKWRFCFSLTKTQELSDKGCHVPTRGLLSGSGLFRPYWPWRVLNWKQTWPGWIV